MNIRGDTITTAMLNAFSSMLSSKEPSASLNIETHFFHTIIKADSCEYNLDLGRDVWLNKGRWSRLIREYVPLGQWTRFKDQCCEILAGEARDGATANFFFHDPKRYAKKHRWGGCLMGATFVGWPSPTLTFQSRTSYIGYMALLDAGIAHVMAREICGEFTDITPADISFRWNLTSAQLHHFKSLPHLYSNPQLFDKLQGVVLDLDSAPTKAWMHIAKWQMKIEQAYNDHGPKMLEVEKYGPFKRIKRRWMEHMGYHGTPPVSCLITSLDFNKCEDVEDEREPKDY